MWAVGEFARVMRSADWSAWGGFYMQCAMSSITTGLALSNPLQFSPVAGWCLLAYLAQAQA